MSLYRQSHIFLLITLLLGGAYGSAQTVGSYSDSSLRDKEWLLHANPWLASGHVLGLEYLPVQKISDAKLYFHKTDGQFINYYESDNSYLAGASTSSYFRLNPSVVLMGQLVYENRKGQHMGGSAFIDPYQQPLGIEELSGDNKGDKKLERYRLTGAVQAKLNQRLSVGGKVDYEAANYAKFKDLRHINKLLNMDIQAGANYAITGGLKLGLSYDYIRRIESLDFSLFGNRDRQYLSLINYGAFFGGRELFSSGSGTSPGYTLANNPMVNHIHRLSLQAEIRLSPSLDWFSSFSYGIRSGYFGHKESSSVVFTEHDAKQYGYKGILTIRRQQLVQEVQLQADYERLKNKLNVYRSETNEGGTSSIFYYGQNQVLDQKRLQAGLGYTAYFQIKDNIPYWTLKADGHFYRRHATTSIYPYFRGQRIHSYSGHLWGNSNIPLKAGLLGISLGLRYGAGDGIVNKDGLYALPGSGQQNSAPSSQDQYLYQEFEYFTKPRAEGELGIKYTHPFNQKTSGFIALNGAYLKAFDTHYAGNNYRSFSLTVGCNF